MCWSGLSGVRTGCSRPFSPGCEMVDATQGKWPIQARDDINGIIPRIRKSKALPISLSGLLLTFQAPERLPETIPGPRKAAGALTMRCREQGSGPSCQSINKQHLPEAPFLRHCPQPAFPPASVAYEPRDHRSSLIWVAPSFLMCIMDLIAPTQSCSESQACNKCECTIPMPGTYHHRWIAIKLTGTDDGAQNRAGLPQAPWPFLPVFKSS